MLEKFRWLATVIAAHPDRRVVGSKRLQMTMLLLQECGLPTDYGYRTFFGGPYSEGLHADARLLEHFGLVAISHEDAPSDENFLYVFTATPDAEIAEIEPYKPQIKILAAADSDVLEVAATYAALRAQGDDDALWRTRNKKRRQSEGGNVEKALKLLQKLGLPTEPQQTVSQEVS
jgi:hypothetical protein